jgi:hypothetical protein
MRPKQETSDLRSLEGMKVLFGEEEERSHRPAQDGKAKDYPE